MRDTDPAVGSFLGDELRNVGVRFPIFEDPRNVVPLLFGQDVTIVIWHLPEFKADFSSPDIYLGTIPVGPIPVNVYAGVDFGVGVNVGVGFDTRGFREGHAFADGFFFQDEGRSRTRALAAARASTSMRSWAFPMSAKRGLRES